MLLPELGVLLRVGRGALGLTPQHQPGRPARSEWCGRRFRYDGERLAQALAAGWDALGLADAADIGRDAARAARVPAQSDLLKKLDGGMTARLPAPEEQRFGGMPDAPSVVRPGLPPRGR